MRKLFTKLVVGLCMVGMLFGCAGLQPMINEESKIDQVFDAPNLTKQQIFEQIKIWIAQNFRSAKAVLEYENKNDGVLIGNSVINYPCSGFDHIAKADWKVLFTMRVDIKDNRFRLSFINLKTSWPARYDSFGFHKAGEGRILRGEFDKIRTNLLAFGDQINSLLNNTDGQKDW